MEVGSVNRDRKDREVKVAVPGTRLLHAVKGIEPGVIGCRLLSCFCPGCEEDGPCDNDRYTLPWQPRALKMKVTPAQSSPIVMEVEEEHGTVSGDTDQDDDQADDLQNVPIQALWNELQGIERLESHSHGDEEDLDMSLNKSALEELDAEMLGIEGLDQLLLSGGPQKTDAVIHLNDNTVDIRPDLFFAVYFSRKPYIGKVVKMKEDGSADMDYLEQRGANGFVWPITKDLETVVEGWRIFYGPIQFSGHHVLSVAEDVMREITRKHAILKKEHH